MSCRKSWIISYIQNRATNLIRINECDGVGSSVQNNKNKKDTPNNERPKFSIKRANIENIGYTKFKDLDPTSYAKNNTWTEKMAGTGKTAPQHKWMAVASAFEAKSMPLINSQKAKPSQVNEYWLILLDKILIKSVLVWLTGNQFLFIPGGCTALHVIFLW